jgi:hypothetical protein
MLFNARSREKKTRRGFSARGAFYFSSALTLTELAELLREARTVLVSGRW